MRHIRRRVITGLVLCTLTGIGLAVALYPRDQPTDHRDQPTVYTVISYTPAICTLGSGQRECGDAIVTARTDDGKVHEFRYDGDRRPEGYTGEAVLVFRPDVKMEITTFGTGGDVIRIKRL